MTELGASSISEMTRVSKVRVQVRADSFIYEGYVFLLAETRRVQEVLNDPKPFLNLTEVVIHDRNSASTNHAPYVALNKGAISHVVVLAGDPTGGAGAGEIPHALEGAAGQPTVPPAGPNTVPAPRSSGRRPKDPPTQPFPHQRVAASELSGEDDVSDLILDDDANDDIDPADLEGESEAGGNK